MAYKYVSNKYVATVKAWHDQIVSLLTAAGWVQHDQVTSQYTIMKSDGSAADGRFVYLKIQMTATQMTAYTNWNATSHVTVGGTCNVGATATVWGGSNTLYAYADLDGVFGWASSGGALVNNSTFALLRPSTLDTLAFHTTTTASCATGSNVVISVTSTTGFVPNARYAIVDAVNGKRGVLRCSAVGTGTITVETVTGGPFASGSYIGTTPFPWFYFATQWGNIGGGHPVNSSGAIATINTAAVGCVGIVPTADLQYWVAMCTPMLGVDTSSRRIMPAPLIDTYSSGWGGFITGVSSLLQHSTSFATTYLGLGSIAYTTNTLLNDAEAFGVQVSGTSSGSNTSTTFNDTSASWTTNEWAGKVLVCTAGTEAGQIAKIVSNTATQLTVEALSTVPTTNTYVIADSGYRVYYNSTGAGTSGGMHLLREGV